MSISLDIDGRSWQSLDLPAEGLLGADAPRPCGAAVEDAGVQLRLAAKLSNPLVVCRGFEWTTSSGGNLARFSEIFVGVCRLRDYSALTRLAPAGPPSKTPAFNFAWRRSCRTRLLSVGGSNGRRRAVETWRGFPKFLWGFAG